MTFVFASLLCFFIFGRFGYPELKKQYQINILEGDTHITRDVGIPYVLAFLVVSPLERLPSLKICFAFLIFGRFGCLERDTHITRDLGIPYISAF